jgi:hypothetical protein
VTRLKDYFIVSAWDLLCCEEVGWCEAIQFRNGTAELIDVLTDEVVALGCSAFDPGWIPY